MQNVYQYPDECFANGTADLRWSPYLRTLPRKMFIGHTIVPAHLRWFSKKGKDTKIANASADVACKK